MTTGTSTGTPAPGSRRAGARERLLAAAERLFYAQGIHPVGVELLCAEAGVSKRSLYQHFDGKDGVVAAMVAAQAERQAARAAADDSSPRERILRVLDRVDSGASRPGFRGCPLVSAAVELKDADHPAARVARAAKQAQIDYLAEAAREGGATDPELLGQQLTLLFDGASAHGVVHGTGTPATRRTAEMLLDAHGVTG